MNFLLTRRLVIYTITIIASHIISISSINLKGAVYSLDSNHHQGGIIVRHPDVHSKGFRESPSINNLRVTR